QQAGAGRYVYEGAALWLLLLGDAARSLPWRGTWRPVLMAAVFLACFNSGALLFEFAAAKTAQMQREGADLQALDYARDTACANGLVPALVMAVAQPVWSRVDEPAHFDVIAQYASGVYPHDSVTTIRPETLDVMQRTGVYGFIVDNAYAKPDVPAELSTMPA